VFLIYIIGVIALVIHDNPFVNILGWVVSVIFLNITIFNKYSPSNF